MFFGKVCRRNGFGKESIVRAMSRRVAPLVWLSECFQISKLHDNRAAGPPALKRIC